MPGVSISTLVKLTCCYPIAVVPFSLSFPWFTELLEDDWDALSGLEDRGAAPADAGSSGLDCSGFKALLLLSSPEGLFAGVTVFVLDAESLLFAKKPAMLCCFPLDFCVVNVGGFFFCEPISLPSMPRAIFTAWPVSETRCMSM